jgi:rhamnose utilization protein RhaD (predicted bifunctional aldolase and dehydrogenase)
MGEIATALFQAPVDRWDTAVAERLSGRDEVLFRSHLVGADPALSKEGGGNFSAKGTVVDHRGIQTRVLWMSAWGCDGASTTADDFPALRLDDLLLLRDSGPVSETEMVEHLLACGLWGEQRRPGIETLTHAFIPAAHVDHCHPDAVIALTSFPEGRQRAEEEFGDEAIWFDYRQYDVDVARELADRIAANPRCRFVLLANHGLFTWADSSEQCYRNSLEAVARATAALDRAIRRPADLGGQAVEPLPDEAARAVLAEALPVLRGALRTGGSGLVLHVDRRTDTVDFASSVRGPQLSELGPGCPDHLVTVGYRPLVLDAIRPEDVDAARAVRDGVDRHRRWYSAYYERHITAAGRQLGRRDDGPRAVVFPGIGVVSAGADAAKARLVADHFGQTMTVIRAADAAGGYVSLTEAQGVADEYWPLMRLKPQLRSAQGRLAGKVVLVVGADERYVGDVAEGLVTANAHVAIAGGDPVELAAVAAEISRRHGERLTVALPGDPAEPQGPVTDAVLAYGGFDVVVDMTGTREVTSAALPVFARQDRGGSVLLVGADRTAEELRLEIAALEGVCASHNVSVNAVATAYPDAVAETAAFFAVNDGWTSAVLAAPGDANDKRVA